MHTHKPGLLYTWTMPMDKTHYVRVFIWRDQRTFLAMTELDGAQACARAGGFAFRDAGRHSRFLIPKKFGELHFHMKKIGSGVVAHEIQHIVNYWITNMGWNNVAHDEKIAYLTGDLVSDFWRQYYKNIP